MKKKLLSTLASTISLMMLFQTTPLTVSAYNSTEYVYVDMNEAGNGLIYDLQEYSSNFSEVKKNPKNDFFALVNEAGAAYNNKPSSLASLNSAVASTVQNLNGVGFKFADKHSEGDNKEGINLRKNDIVEVDLPDGCYDEIHYLGFSQNNSNGVVVEAIYNDQSKDTISEHIVDSYKTMDSSTMTIQGYLLWNYPWTASYGGSAIYLHGYSAEVDSSKILDKISFSTDAYVSIPAITGELNIDATKASVETILAGSVDDLIEQEVLLKSLIKTLEDNGVDKSEILGSERLDNLENEIIKNDLKNYFAMDITELIANIDEVEGLIEELAELGEDISSVQGFERYDTLEEEAKTYVETELEKSEEEILAQRDVLEVMVTFLGDKGISRSDIANIDKLNSLSTEYVFVDVKGQANGLIYMTSASDYTKIDVSELSDTDFLYKKPSASQRLAFSSSLAETEIVIGDVNYIMPAMRKNGKLSDKEGIVTRAEMKADVDVPDGYYTGINALMVAAGKDTSATITIHYADAPDEVKNITIYGLNNEVDEGDTAERGEQYRFFRVWSWEDPWTSCDYENGYVFSYKIPVSRENVVTGYTIESPLTSTMTIAVSGDYLNRNTAEFVGRAIENAEDLSLEDLLYYGEMIETLEKCGINRNEISNIDAYDAAIANFLWVSKSEYKSDTAKTEMTLSFSQPVDVLTLTKDSITLFRNKEKLSEETYDIIPIVENGECKEVVVGLRHYFNYDFEYEVVLSKDITAENGTALIEETIKKMICEKPLGISDFSVTYNEPTEENGLTEAQFSFNCSLINNIADTDENTLFVGMYSEDNKLLDYHINRGVRSGSELTVKDSFVCPGAGKYVFKCMLVNSYSTLVLMDKPLWRSIEIE